MARGDPNLAPVGIDFINRFYKTGLDNQIAANDAFQRQRAGEAQFQDYTELRPYVNAAAKAGAFGEAFKNTLAPAAYGINGLDMLKPFGVGISPEGNIQSGTGGGQVSTPLESYLQEATANTTLGFTHGRTPTGAHTAAGVGGIDFGFGLDAPAGVAAAGPAGAPAAAPAAPAAPVVPAATPASRPAASNVFGIETHEMARAAPSDYQTVQNMGLTEADVGELARRYGMTPDEVVYGLSQRHLQNQILHAPASGPPDYGNVPVGGQAPAPAQAPAIQAAPTAERYQQLLGPMRQTESSGNRYAISKRHGEILGLGPFQFKPETYMEVAHKHGLPLDGIFDDGTSAQAASLYMMDLEKQFAKHGEKAPLLALMAYNWGPGNVNKWIKNGADPGSVPVETANYIQKLSQYLPEPLPLPPG